MSALIVTAAVAVLPTRDGREQYLYEGAVFDPEAITEAGIEHARAQGLIGDAPEVVEEEPVEAALTQADVDAAVKAATDAKDVELAAVRKDLEAARAEVGKADARKVETPNVSAAKTTAAKQS
ncbi:hypothetical protein [Microbacterium sp. Ag1]|uniref:hypothetical protein n=1 Tax=Microbacterium sp. Ag1 TaxID=1643443 RepID=UPI0006298382|nr:hypothetical protein [Microbacterium sp. Ag1]KKX97737.1 hypothetical protein AAY78_11125 [Microbacterium sp. Ag1]